MRTSKAKATPQLELFPSVPLPYANDDHCARLILMSCYLYYCCDVNVLSDGDFDKCCQHAAEFFNRLSPLRQFLLGSPGQIRATGHHVLVTDLAVCGACRWYFDKTGNPTPWHELEWTWNERFHLHTARLV